MITYKEVTETHKIAEEIECDICKKRWKTEGDDVMEVQEFTHINFVASYGFVALSGILALGSHLLYSAVGIFFP